MRASSVDDSRRSTSAEDTERLCRDAQIILDNVGMSMPRPRLSRMVRTFRGQVEGKGWAFFDYVTNAVQLSEGRKRAARSNPEILRVIGYADPTGETAVANVLRSQRHG